MKELDSRSDTQLTIPCTCGHYGHQITLDYSHYDDKFKEFYLTIFDEPHSFWERIKSAIKYVVRGGKLYWMESTITESDMVKIEKLFNEYRNLEGKDELISKNN